MRTVRLGRTFDAVFVHDAVCYLLTEDDVLACLMTAREHCRPGGIVVVVPDDTRETWVPDTDHGGSDGTRRPGRPLPHVGLGSRSVRHVDRGRVRLRAARRRRGGGGRPRDPPQRDVPDRDLAAPPRRRRLATRHRPSSRPPRTAAPAPSSSATSRSTEPAAATRSVSPHKSSTTYAVTQSVWAVRRVRTRCRRRGPCRPPPGPTCRGSTGRSWPGSSSAGWTTAHSRSTTS